LIQASSDFKENSLINLLVTKSTLENGNNFKFLKVIVYKIKLNRRIVFRLFEQYFDLSIREIRG